MLRYGRNQDNIVKKLSFNLKLINFKKKIEDKKKKHGVID